MVQTEKEVFGKMVQEGKIYEARKQLDLSQEELAEKLGVTRNTISRWELGNAKPSMEKLAMLSELCGVSLDELIRGEPAHREEAPAVPDPPAQIPKAPARTKRWPIAVLCIGVVCALVIGIIALVGIYSINEKLGPADTAVPIEELKDEEVDISQIESVTLQPLQP